MQPYRHVYKHYKGRYYRVLCDGAEHSESGEELVVYQQLYRSKGRPAGYVWVRPAKLFHDIVQELVKSTPVPHHRYNTSIVTSTYAKPQKRFEKVKKVPRSIARLIKKLDRVTE